MTHIAEELDGDGFELYGDLNVEDVDKPLYYTDCGGLVYPNGEGGYTFYSPPPGSKKHTPGSPMPDDWTKGLPANGLASAAEFESPVDSLFNPDEVPYYPEHDCADF